MEIDSRGGDYENRINHNVCLPVEKKIGVIFPPKFYKKEEKKLQTSISPPP